MFLQPLPGEDPSLLAGLLHLILENHWHDAEFCSRYVNGLDALRAAVAPFTLGYVAVRAGVPESELYRAAETFARIGRRGSAASGTGPNMARHSNLAEHLLECMNVVCGRYARPDDPVANPGVVGPRLPRRAEISLSRTPDIEHPMPTSRAAPTSPSRIDITTRHGNTWPHEHQNPFLHE